MLLGGLLALAGLAGPARADDLVLEAAFLSDSQPAEGLDLGISLSLAPAGEPDQGRTLASPRAQLAAGLGAGLGLSVDAGLLRDGQGRLTAAPLAASLKALVAEDRAAGRALTACLDVQAVPGDWAETEVGLGLGAALAAGPITLRGAAWAMTAAGRWDPHAHAGLSAALALGGRWRLLGEAVGDLRAHGAALAAGPTLKVALAEGTALSAGALLHVAPRAGLASVLLLVTQVL